MAVADILRELENAEALLALAGEDPGHATADPRVLSAVAETLIPGAAFRVGIELLPSWWRNGHDPTQVDSRILFKSVEQSRAHASVRLHFFVFQIPAGGPTIFMTPGEFFRAAKTHRLGDAT